MQVYFMWSLLDPTRSSVCEEEADLDHFQAGYHPPSPIDYVSWFCGPTRMVLFLWVFISLFFVNTTWFCLCRTLESVNVKSSLSDPIILLLLTCFSLSLSKIFLLSVSFENGVGSGLLVPLLYTVGSFPMVPYPPVY